ncbi:MAG: hypothetical protein ACXITV_13185 [Luteibaculaceae bacterium]
MLRNLLFYALILLGLSLTSCASKKKKCNCPVWKKSNQNVEYFSKHMAEPTSDTTPKQDTAI